jgi:hypothetical protein
MIKYRKKLLVALCCGLLSLSCFSQEKHKTGIQTGLLKGPYPWTHDKPDAEEDNFMFAVFSDLTGGERAGVFETAVQQLNLLRPEIIVNVGDLIEGGSDSTQELNRQWDDFDRRADQAKAPLFYVGGNHDLTGGVLRGVWEERYGPHYYHFVYKNVLFLVMDTEDNTAERMKEINAARDKAVAIYKDKGLEAFEKTEYANMPERKAGTISADQSRYFVEAIRNNPDVRWTFILVHKPAWERQGENHFLKIEEALSERPYTLFNGHVQAYKYQQRHGRDYIQLATTGGEQFPDKGRSMDHITLVTVSESGVDIANILMSGILDKTGHIPNDGDELCFELSVCGPEM